MNRWQGRFIPLSGLLAAGRPADLPVCIDGHRSVAWDEFAQICGAVGRALRRRPEPRWLIHCEHPLHFAAALLAVLHAGRRAVVAPGLQPGMTAQLRPAYDAVVGDADQPMLDVRSLAPAPFAFERLEPRAAFMDLYTSGSSGEPKRVEKSLHQLETEARALEAAFGETLVGAAVVATVPHHHIYGLLFRLVWPLAAGRPFDARLCADPEQLLKALARHAQAALVSSPAHLARLPELLELAALKPATRRIFSSGGPLPAAAAAQFHRALGAAPTEVYGSTESGGIGWREQDGSEESAAWRPFEGMRMRAGADGALCLRSPYLPDEAWLTLDDAVEFLPDGRFRLKGRLDRVVKLEGKRVSLPELELALRTHPRVADAAVVALGGSRQRLGAVVVLRAPATEEGRRALVAALREHLLERFERVVVPRHWRFVARLPLDERGKTTASGLRELFDGDADARAS